MMRTMQKHLNSYVYNQFRIDYILNIINSRIMNYLKTLICQNHYKLTAVYVLKLLHFFQQKQCNNRHFLPCELLLSCSKQWIADIKFKKLSSHNTPI